MKKVFVSILAILYLATSMGATVHLHYCMGRLVSWGLAAHSENICDFCGMQKMDASASCMVGAKNCCHEESKQFKNDKDQKTGQDFFQAMQFVPARADLPLAAWIDPIVPSFVLSRPVPHGPPSSTAIPVFLRNCDFRI